MDPATAFRDEVERLLRAAFDGLGHDGDLPSLEVPPDPAMGDLGCPCFPLAKSLRKAPAAIAADVVAAMDVAGTEWVHEARAVGPYVNLFLDRTKAAVAVLADPDAALTCDPKPGKVLLEHTSANPNGPLHVGRARNPILGDTLARMHRAAGYDTEVQYYMDNLGRQVALLYWGKQHIDPGDLDAPRLDKPDHDLVRYYQAANERMENDPDVAAEIKALVARLETADEDLLQEVRKVYEACFEGMQRSLRRLGVEYDSIKDESDLIRSGAVDEVIEALKRSPRAGVEADGANYLDMAAELEGNKSTRFFFTRRDGSSVYATRDVAYHHWKAQQVGDDGHLLDVLGEDHRLQALQVGIALEELGHRRPEVVFYAFVSLPEGKMSTRANRVVFLDDLLEETVVRARAAVQERRGDELPREELDRIAEAVGIAAIRFNIARVQAEKPIRFRWEDALDFDGDSAPYILYAYARARSLLRRADEAGLVAGDVDPACVGGGETRLLLAAGRLPARLEDAVEARAPHRFCAYALELAAALNEYYRDHPVLDCEDPTLQNIRLRSVQVAEQALRRTAEALGLPLLSSM